MSRIHLARGFFVYDGCAWPADQILCDTSAAHPKGPKWGLLYTPTPEHVDILFEAGEKVVGVESKTWSDLATSRTNGRLARQLRTLLELVDISVLLIRGEPRVDLPWEQYREERLECARWQAMGAVVISGPFQDAHLADYLQACRPILAGGRNALKAVAVHEREPKERQPGWLLRRIPYVGPELSRRLIAKFGTTRAALVASDEAWKELKVPDRVLEARRQAMEE